MSDIAPQEPQTNHRVLLGVVIGLGVLFVIAIVVSIVLAVTRHAPAPSQVFALPPGAVIVAMESQQNRLILHVRSREGDEIDIVDTADGHLVARIK